MAQYWCRFEREDICASDPHGFWADDDQEASDVVRAIAVLLLRQNLAIDVTVVTLLDEAGSVILSSSLRALRADVQ